MNTALVAHLWESNQHVLERYLTKGGRTVIAPMENCWGEHIKAMAREFSSHLISLESMLTDTQLESLQQLARRKAAQYVDLPMKGSWMQQDEILQINEKKFAQLVGDEIQAKLFNELFVIEALNIARSKFGIELVIVNEDLMLNARTMVEWAKHVGIPTLHVEHALPALNPYTIHKELHADVFAISGERALEGYLDVGFDESRIRVVGFPGADCYVAMRGERMSIRMQMAAKYGFSTDIPIIVFGTTWHTTQRASADPDIYNNTLRSFLSACVEMSLGGGRYVFVVKDRPQNAGFGKGRVVELARELGLPASSLVYTLEDTTQLIQCADVVISIDSAMSVEAMLAGTNAINLLNETGLRLGPCFAADDGIVEVEPEFLAQEVLRILNNASHRDALRQNMSKAAPRYNLGVDGHATERLITLMEELAIRNPEPVAYEAIHGAYIWETRLNVSDDGAPYPSWAHSELVDFALRSPHKVLDIGCAEGKTGEYIKKKFPQAQVFGVVETRTAAVRASERIDGVFTGCFEDFDFAAMGIEPASLDTVVIAGVLEHEYNPWAVMVRLKPYLTPDAQILVSVPNARNLALMESLAEGKWHYGTGGVLNITHTRFFTLKEIRRFFYETGYRVVKVMHKIDGRLAPLFRENMGKAMTSVEYDRIILKNITQEELSELCSDQLYIVAEADEPGGVSFDTQEKVLEADAQSRVDYDLWAEPRFLTGIQGSLFEQRMSTWPVRPVFHLVITCMLGIGRLAASIQSLATQYYRELQLTVVAIDAPPDDWIDSDRMVWLQASEENLIETVNGALLSCNADWVGAIDAGDTVAPHSLLFFAEAINSHPEWRFVYSDEDMLLPDGKYGSPHFKPDFNLDLLRSVPYTGGLAVVAHALFEDLGGFSSTLSGSEDRDLVLRAYEQAGAGAIGHLPDVLYHRLKDGGRWQLPANEMLMAGKRALEGHLARLMIRGSVEHGLFPGSYRVRYEHEAKPRVSILVAVKDQLAALQRCIESLLATTQYPDYEILIIDNGSTSPEMLGHLEGLESLGNEHIRVYTHSAANSLPLLHNLLASEARGEYLLFLRFDAAMVQNDWLDCLMAHALRPEVGMVSPRLLRADGTVAQTGLVLGLGNSVDTPFKGESNDYAGYFGLAHLEQDFSALGGGCLLVRKSLFTDLGGFNANDFATDFAEADFTQRARSCGFLAVWTPFVSILCDGATSHQVWGEVSSSRDAIDAVREMATEQLYRRWLPQLARDPAYNINLSLESGKDYTLEKRSVLNWNPLPWRPLPRILAHPADAAGCGEYRIISPMRALVAAGRVQGWADFHILSVPEMERMDVDSVILQRQTMPEQIRMISRLKRFSRALRVYELDDLLINVPLKSLHNADMPRDVVEKLREGLAMCDRFIVSTEPLKAIYQGFHSDIRVMPNTLERAVWGGFSPLRGQSLRPRVGWAGGVGHTGDLEMIYSVVKALADKVDWVFMGMCPDHLKPWVKEFQPGVPLAQYPSKLASLNLDLAIAPLEQNQFNEAKSNLRLLEYGILGYPVVCSDVYPYQGEIPVIRVRNRHQDWVDAIVSQIEDMHKLASQGDQLREHINSHWMLEDHLDEWMRAWLP